LYGGLGHLPTVSAAPAQSVPAQISAKDRLRRARLIVSEAAEFLGKAAVKCAQ